MTERGRHRGGRRESVGCIVSTEAVDPKNVNNTDVIDIVLECYDGLRGSSNVQVCSMNGQNAWLYDGQSVQYKRALHDLGICIHSVSTLLPHSYC